MRLSFIFFFTVLLCLPSYAESSAKEVIAQGKSLVLSQSYQQAYDFLKKHEGTHSGLPNFDYYLGLSALQIGKPAEAVFALERALLVDPNIPQARADLGRAYYMLGENKSAKVEFDKVKADKNVSPQVQNTIDQFLLAIQNRFDASGKRLEFFIDSGIGYDDNINSATSLSDLFIPVIGLTTSLDESSRKTDSPFIEIKPAIRYSQPLTESLNFITSGDIEINSAIDESEFSTQIINARTGLALLRGSNEYRGTLAFQNYKVDSNSLRDQLALNVEWHKSFSVTSRLVSFLQIANLEFDDQPLRDGDQNSLGATWLRSISNSLYFLGLYIGQENKDAASQRFNERDFIGVRLGGQWVHKKNSLFANLTFQQSDNSATDPSFLLKRNSDYTSLEVGYRVPFRKNLLITPKIDFTKNDANVDFYSFERTIIGVYARYTF